MKVYTIYFGRTTVVAYNRSGRPGLRPYGDRSFRIQYVGLALLTLVAACATYSLCLVVG